MYDLEFWGFGSHIQDFGSGVWGSGSRVSDSVSGFRFRVSGFGFSVLGLGFRERTQGYSAGSFYGKASCWSVLGSLDTLGTYRSGLFTLGSSRIARPHSAGV